MGLARAGEPASLNMTLTAIRNLLGKPASLNDDYDDQENLLHVPLTLLLRVLINFD